MKIRHLWRLKICNRSEISGYLWFHTHIKNSFPKAGLKVWALPRIPSMKTLICCFSCNDKILIRFLSFIFRRFTVEVGKQILDTKMWQMHFTQNRYLTQKCDRCVSHKTDTWHKNVTDVLHTKQILDTKMWQMCFTQNRYLTQKMWQMCLTQNRDGFLKRIM